FARALANSTMRENRSTTKVVPKMTDWSSAPRLTSIRSRSALHCGDDRVSRYQQESPALHIVGIAEMAAVTDHAATAVRAVGPLRARRRGLGAMNVVLMGRNGTQHRRRLCRRCFAQVLHVRVDRRFIHASRESTGSNKSGDGREYGSP